MDLSDEELQRRERETMDMSDEEIRRRDDNRAEFQDLIEWLSPRGRAIYLVIIRHIVQLRKPFRHVLYRN